MPEAFTSDGEPRSNVEPAMDIQALAAAAPVVPPSYYTIGESARVSALVSLGSVLNAQLDHWAGTTPHCKVVDQSAAYSHNNVVGNINALIMTMNAACTEHSILTTAGQRMVPFLSLGYNAFTPAMNAIRSQLVAMQAALP